MDYPAELTAQQRAALITLRLLAGDKLTNTQIADICGYAERHSAYYLMMRLAHVMPLTFSNGEWWLVRD